MKGYQTPSTVARAREPGEVVGWPEGAHRLTRYTKSFSLCLEMILSAKKSAAGGLVSS
jgi:hypothetical protein